MKTTKVIFQYESLVMKFASKLRSIILIPTYLPSGSGTTTYKQWRMTGSQTLRL